MGCNTDNTSYEMSDIIFGGNINQELRPLDQSRIENIKLK